MSRSKYRPKESSNYSPDIFRGGSTYRRRRHGYVKTEEDRVWCASALRKRERARIKSEHEHEHEHEHKRKRVRPASVKLAAYYPYEAAVLGPRVTIKDWTEESGLFDEFVRSLLSEHDCRAYAARRTRINDNKIIVVLEIRDGHDVFDIALSFYDCSVSVAKTAASVTVVYRDWYDLPYRFDSDGLIKVRKRTPPDFR